MLLRERTGDVEIASLIESHRLADPAVRAIEFDVSALFRHFDNDVFATPAAGCDALSLLAGGRGCCKEPETSSSSRHHSNPENLGEYA